MFVAGIDKRIGRAGGTAAALDHDLVAVLGEGTGADGGEEAGSPVRGTDQYSWAPGRIAGGVVVGEKYGAVGHGHLEVAGNREVVGFGWRQAQ